MLQIIAPGAGYEASGNIELLAGQDRTVEIPPLAKFATIRGKLKAAPPKGAYIKASALEPLNCWLHPSSTIDSNRNFRIDDIIPGEVTINEKVDEPNPPYLFSENAEVSPGENYVIDLTLRAKAAVKILGSLEDAFNPSSNSSGASNSASGRGVDANGAPIARADVYLETIHYNGHFDEQYVIKTQTDSSGKYVFNKPLAKSTGESVLFIAHVAGHPIAIEELRRAEIASSANFAPADLVIPGNGASLDVHVFKDGKSFSGAEKAAKELSVLLEPSAATDSEGIGHFSQLSPGLWQAVAGETKDPVQFNYFEIFGIHFCYGASSGIPLISGEKAECALDLLEPFQNVNFRIFDPQGAFPNCPGISISAGERNFESSWSTYGKADARGNVSQEFGHRGLWNIRAAFRDIPLAGIPISNEPFYQVNSVIAASSLTGENAPITLRAVLKKPGSIHVTLRDENGKPAFGAVTLVNFAMGIEYGLSTDSRGEGVFPNMSSGTYELNATIYGRQKELRCSPLQSDERAWRFLLNQ